MDQIQHEFEAQMDKRETEVCGVVFLNVLRVCSHIGRVVITNVGHCLKPHNRIVFYCAIVSTVRYSAIQFVKMCLFAL